MSFAQTCGCVDCPRTIPITNSDFTLDYIVSGLDNDDLSGTQCIESVNLVFQHNRIQNLVIELISPSGQVVPLVGPYQQFGGGLNGSLGATWDIDFVQCFPEGQANPDPGAMEAWSNMDPVWNVFGGNFTGDYYPTEGNCLQNFNTGSANGTWQLRVQNFDFPPPAGPGTLESIEIVFCDDDRLGCCGADAGEIFDNVPALDICESSPNLTFGFNPSYDNGDEPDPLLYGYHFLITRNDSIIAVQESIDLNGFPDGTYVIYGISHLLSDTNIIENLAGNNLLSDLNDGTIDICNEVSINDFRITLEPALAVVPLAISICEGDSIFIDGEFRKTAGSYRETILVPDQQCDSIFDYTLSIIPTEIFPIGGDLCAGDSFPFGGQMLTEAGIYRDTLQSSSGCDSIVVLDLVLLPTANRTIDISICEGESFPFDGQDLTVADTYETTLQAVNGCDSIVTLNLTVLETITDTLNESICEGQSFPFNGQDLTLPDVYQATFSAQNGCDSIVTLNLSVLEVIRDTIDQEICQGQSFTFDGQDLVVADTYEATFISQSGCDSIVTLNLSVSNVIEENIVQSICSGETFPFGNQTLSVAGTYRDTLQTPSGCDSIVILELSVDDVIEENIAQSICSGESFPFGNQTLSITGTYRDTLQTPSGCDSIIILELTVDDIIEENITQSICQGESFPFGNQTLSITGTYRDTLQTPSGCDSIIILELTVDDIIEENITQSICQGESFPFGNQTLSVAGTYRDTLQTTSGCDSIVILNLSVDDIIEENITQSICSGESFPFGNQTLSITGTYRDTLQTMSGCDSIVILELTVDDVIEENIAQSICSGESFPFGNQTLSITGTYRDTLQTPSGCDSIIILELTVDDIIEENIAQSICSGETFPFGNQTLSVAATYRDTLQTTSGCDSIVILNLSVDDIIEENITQSICQGESFPFGNQTLSITGTYRDTLQTPSGCDSIIILELTVDNIIEENIAQSICSGETFPFGNQTLSVAGTYRDTLQTMSGCDSIVILELSVDDVIEENIAQSICSGETFPFGNQTLSVAGTYRDTLQTTSGCDSIVILELSVEDFNISIVAESNSIGCEFEEVQLTAQINGDFTRIQWLKNGIIIDSTAQINVLESGEYQLLVESKNACIAEDIIEISEQLGNIGIDNLNIQQPNCEGNEVGFISVDSISGGMPPYLYALNENTFSTNPNFTNLEVGDYVLKIQDAQGCEWDTMITILPATDLTVNLGDDIVLSFGQSATIEAIINKTTITNINWSTSGKDSLSCKDCLEQTVSPMSNTIYQIRVEDEEGCVAIDQISVFVERTEDFFIPNAFSPNGDSNNDFFYLQTNNSTVQEIENLQIFDRWGHLVFQRNNFLPNDETLGWDGRSQNGTLMNPAVFIFTAKVNYIDGSVKMLEGEVTLLR